MTADMCPFISEEPDKDPCPECIIQERAPKVHKQDNVINTCLADIREDIEEGSDEARQMFQALRKLRRLTASEEEPIVGIDQKKEVLEILALVDDNRPSLDKSQELQLEMDMGNILFNIGDYDRALDGFIPLSKTDPANKKVWNNMGVIMVRMGKDRDALECYDKALELEPKYGSAWFNKGKALFRLGQKKKALECFRKATKFSPENKSAWNNLGVTLRQLKKFRESIKCYDRALKIHSKYPWAWHNKGVALMDMKRYKQAMHCFDRALQIDPRYEPARASKKDLMRKLM
jgi:tetratricopeptide (TPR) repeat protein